MTGFVLRAGTIEDLADILALEKSIDEAPHWPEAAYADAIRSRSDHHIRRIVFVAEQQAKVIGFAIGKMIADVSELESVAVAVSARRGGVGKALCDAVIQWSQSQRAAAVDLEVRVANGRGVALYRNLGFREVGRRQRYYDHPVEDAILMRLDLSERG